MLPDLTVHVDVMSVFSRNDTLFRKGGQFYKEGFVLFDPTMHPPLVKDCQFGVSPVNYSISDALNDQIKLSKLLDRITQCLMPWI